MSWAQFCVETAATAAEAWLVITAAARICGHRYASPKQTLLNAGAALAMTAIVLLLNSLRIFSAAVTFITILAAVCLTGYTSAKPRLFRAFAVLLVYLAVVSVDYIVLFAFSRVLEIPVTSTAYFSRLVGFGPLKCWFLLIDKGIDFVLYMALKKRLHKLQMIHRSFLTALVMTMIFANIVTPAILSLAWSDYTVTLQMAIICSWLLILVCVCIALCFSILTSKYQDEKARNDFLDICGSMMEENYQRLYSHQQATARLVHDVNHHMGVLRELSLRHGDEEIRVYIDSLLEDHYKELPMCKSGNSIVNAIINCKVSEASQCHISFRYIISSDVPSSLAPADLCAVLANQIDNAFDACKKIEDASRRSVDVRIWQNSENLYLFQVSNTIEYDPLVRDPELRTTKTDQQHLHGFGIRNIRETAEKYGGVLVNSTKDGRFYSTVFLNLES